MVKMIVIVMVKVVVKVIGEENVKVIVENSRSNRKRKRKHILEKKMQKYS